jgi:ATP-dependent Clp protease ATP-binding subunit ClpA
MHERFSDRARHAMALANLEATRLKHGFLAPAHLMLGLIAEGECVATAALVGLNVNLETIRDRVRSELAQRGSDDTSVGRRAQTKEMKQVVSSAIEEARRFGHRYVGTEHLVLGLLQVPEGIPYKILRDEGVDLEVLREKTLALLREPIEDGAAKQPARRGDFEWVHQQELAKAFRSPTFWHTMILAVDSANRLGAGEVEPRHLLLALVRDKSNGIGDVLAEKGITMEWLHERLTAAS